MAQWPMPEYDFTYHSGTGETFIGLRSPADVEARARAFIAAPQALRRIRFQTAQYAPGHIVTIRTSSEGWTNDTFGTYRDGAWEFFLEIPSLPPTLAFKFVLDGGHWMHGPDLSVSTSVDHSFDENTIHFSPAVNRFRHGYDNFHIDRTKLAQDGVPRNIPDGNPFGGSKRHAKAFLFEKAATFADHPFNVEVVVNPELWQVRNSDDELVPVPNPSKIKMTFTFASLLDDANRVSSPGVGQKLSVRVKRNQAGVAHFDAARVTRNAILASLGVPFTAEEGMGYGNEGTVHHAGGTLRMSGNATGVVDSDLRFEA